MAATSIGLFEQTNANYGEIWYELDGKKTMSRVTTAEGVLEAIYSLAGITPPQETDDADFSRPSAGGRATSGERDILRRLAILSRS